MPDGLNARARARSPRSGFAACGEGRAILAIVRRTATCHVARDGGVPPARLTGAEERRAQPDTRFRR
jgi:hypothetical protein